MRDKDKALPDLFIVLIGESDPSLVDRLKEKYAGSLAGSFFGPARMALIEVPERLGKLLGEKSKAHEQS